MNPTIKLYYQDSYMRDFHACILSINENCIVLDQTAFFPESGGQYADPGSLGGSTVIDVQEIDGIIYHYVEGDFHYQVGDIITGVLDWPIRYMKMQQHTGEHIISGLMMKHLGIRNVGFHLGTEISTLDFAEEVSKDKLREIESIANQAIYNNLEVMESWPSAEEAEQIPYRSKIEIGEDLRLIVIPDVDICACCAPHVHRTGEVGAIRIIDSIRYKGGIRITIICGTRVIEDHRTMEAIIRELSISLSAPREQIPTHVQQLKEEIISYKREIHELQQQILQYKVLMLPIQDQHILFEPELSGENPRYLINLVLEQGCNLCAVFYAGQDGNYRYVIGSKTKDIRSLGTCLNDRFQGRGGGTREMVQGMLNASEDQIRAFFTQEDTCH